MRTISEWRKFVRHVSSTGEVAAQIVANLVGYRGTSQTRSTDTDVLTTALDACLLEVALTRDNVTCRTPEQVLAAIKTLRSWVNDQGTEIWVNQVCFHLDAASDVLEFKGLQ